MRVGRSEVQVWGWLTALVCAAAAQGDRANAYVFRGVEPGTTTAEAVRSDDRWGEPAQLEQADDGTQRWTYQPRGYRSVVVTMSGDRVQTVDVHLPSGVSARDAAAALKLGLPVEGAELGDAVGMGPEMPEAWEPVPYSAGRVVLYVDRQSKQARVLRSFAPEVLGTTAAAAAPDESATSTGGHDARGGPLTSLSGQDRDSRLIVATLAKILPQYHISRHPFDRQLVERMQGLLLKSIDGQQLYFTRDDVRQFRRGADRLRRELARGDLSQVYDLYQTLAQRVVERVALVDDLLADDFDFTVDERYVSDPQGDAWAENDLEAREAWRKRVKYELLTHLEAGADLEEAKARVARKVHAVVDQWQKTDDNDLLSRAAEAMFWAYDPRSTYYSPRAWKDMLIGLRSEMVGIGASLAMQNGYVEVQTLIAGGPSEQDGRLKPGDRIVGVGQGTEGEVTDVVGMKLAETVDLIRGKEGTTVRLLVLPKDGFETTIVDLTRGRFELQRIGSAVLDTEDAGREGQAKIGYIYLPTIYGEWNSGQTGNENVRSTANDLEKILANMRDEDVDVLVADLRGNPGGMLLESIEVAGLFVGKKRVLMVRDGQGQVSSHEPQRDHAVWNRPLVVLTNKRTSGGGEIVPAAVQDYGRGIVVGDSTTNGNGTVATTRFVTELTSEADSGDADSGDVERLGTARFTIEKFYRVNGDGFQGRGLEPDIVLPSATEVTLETQADLSYSLAFDKVKPQQSAPAEKALDDTAKKDLERASASRRDGSEYFERLAELTESFLQRGKRRAVPLKRDKFHVYRLEDGELAPDAPKLPGIPNIKLTPYLQEVLAVSLDYAAWQHFTAAEAARDQRKYSSALDDYRRALAANPDLQRARYKLAWSLATLPNSRFRDGDEAVAQARELVERDGRKKWSYLFTLAVAEAEAGNFDQAVTELEAALELAPASSRNKYSYLKDRFRRRQKYSSR